MVGSYTYYNAWANKMSELRRLLIVVVWEAAVRQYCLNCHKEGGNIHHDLVHNPYAAAVVKMTRPVIITPRTR